jgi:predicted dithiol-disulfide oxidoreductase (DUF899 family)
LSGTLGEADGFVWPRGTSHRENEKGFAMSLPKVVSPEQWREARVALLAEEKAMTRARDALNTRRRELPMVEVDKGYVFHGPDGEASLLDLFDGRRQLIVQHFMFHPDWDRGCPSCTASAEEISAGLLGHLHTRDTSFAVVSRAPQAKIEAYKASKGWAFPWFSSHGSNFNYDFHVTLDESVAPVEYNYRTAVEFAQVGQADALDGNQPLELPGYSCFLRDGDDVFHTYSMYARAAESLGGSYYFLDLTALGRQEDWEEPKGRATDARGAIPDFST